MASFKSDTIYVSNLDLTIGEEELRNEIFVSVGTISSISIVYDKFGKSAGSATIRFQTSKQAEKAFQDYNGAQVDGKVMSVQLIGTPIAPRVIVKAAPAPKAAVVKKAVPPTANKAKKAPVKTIIKTVTVPAQQRPRRAATVAPTRLRGASRPVISPRAPSRRTIAQPAAIKTQGVAPRRGAAAASKKPVATRRSAAPAANRRSAAPAQAPAKKAAPKKAAPKKLSAAQLDAQLDKYNAGREQK